MRTVRTDSDDRQRSGAAPLAAPQAGSKNILERLDVVTSASLSAGQLKEAGFRFVRYADDFVVLCRSRDRAEEARDFVEQRTKSVDKYKDRMRELTKRSHNLDAKAVEKINSVVRGVACYFGTTFATVTKQFEKLDIWLRSRLRSMKFKRKSKNDNFRLKNKHLRRLGLTWLRDFLPAPEG